ncbi:hypothetical protein ACFSSA_02045 [Luteolibacter algae]|uniref:NlpC/P60 domain-containing protein n=1 Tax=Luteolibacter algae TaxID=454151 RepID=A0ABW5D723_9BACT
MRFFSLIAIAGACLVSCAPQKRSPEDAVLVAKSYAELEWMPEARHIRHGKDSKGIIVHTPDKSLSAHTDDKRGWWQPGKPATGMAYKWGGFDTPESFLAGLKAGKKAGDVANSYKVRNDNAVVSEESVGIDCSGFVSRCWGLDRHVSTKDLPGICEPVGWGELRKGDILLKNGHVLMFLTYQDSFVIGYEAGPIPTWRARICAIHVDYLKKNDYAPWRYRLMDEPAADAETKYYDIDFSREQWRMGPY